jgi:CO/xanthine dehydrogenase Mo-binding subunit
MSGALPQFISDNPRLGDWFTFGESETIALKTGKVEIGQGILTALLQIAAEELDLPLSALRIISGDTKVSPKEGPTVASLSIMMSGPATRAASVQLRQALFRVASERLRAPMEALSAQSGTFFVNGESSAETYWSVKDGVDLDETIKGDLPAKHPAHYSVIGTSPAPADLICKILGAAFIHDLTLPKMLHGRALRQPFIGARLIRADTETIASMDGVIAVVRDGDFIGVVAETESRLFKAMERIERVIGWDMEATENANLTPIELLEQGSVTRITVSESSEATDRNWQYSATFTKPLIGHGSIGPSCAIALFDEDGLSIWTHSQNVFGLRQQVSRVIELPVDKITVRHVLGAGCYGHNGADDVAMDAVLLARAVPGRPVRAQWSRRDELRAEPLSTPMKVVISASLDEGRISAWNLITKSGTHVQRPAWNGQVNLLAAAALSKPWPFTTPVDVPVTEGGGGGAKNSVAGYEFPQRVTYEFVTDLPFRVSSMRSLGAFTNVVAIESAMDDLAAMANCDPVEFRLRHLTDPRSRAVIEAVVEMSSWQEADSEGQANGIGFAQFENELSYCAVVAKVAVDEKVELIEMWAAVDAGLAINPGGIVAQVEGGMIQSASWLLKEAVPTSGRLVTSETWQDYPILRFEEIPKITVKVISRGEDMSMGVGEVAMGPAAAAIANAVARAIGVRVTHLPITRDRIVETIMAA